MPYRRAFFILLLPVFIASCAINLSFLIGRENELKNREDFNAYVAREYLEYARYLANEYNWNDSDFFAKKGLRAADNKEVFPEVPERWDLDASQIEEASLGRQKLETLILPKTKEYLPIQLAHLLLLYDCWIVNEKHPYRIAEMSKCKVRFFKLADEIEKYMDNLQPPEVIKTVEIKAPQFKKFNIYFDFDGYKLTDSANNQFVLLFAHLAELNGDYRILLVGAADASGKSLYNDALARKRVLTVQNQLTKNGVPLDLIELKSFGEIKPDIVTSDGKMNQNNRVVAIYVLKGVDSLSPIPLPLIDNYIYKQELLNNRKELGLE